VPGYPIEPDKLLDAADRLAPANPGRGRPPYTAHRRAVSTAYYAVFHAIGARVVATAFPSADEVFRQGVRRWIGHGDIRAVATWISQIHGTTGGSPPTHIRALLAPAGQPPHIDGDTVVIAEGFVELNEKREQADYDHGAVFSRPDTRGHIALARQVVATVEQTQTDPSTRFFGLVALQARVQAR